MFKQDIIVAALMVLWVTGASRRLPSRLGLFEKRPTAKSDVCGTVSISTCNLIGSNRTKWTNGLGAAHDHSEFTPAFSKRRHLIMDRAVIASVVVGLGCMSLCGLGTGCLFYPTQCPVSTSVVIPMGIVGLASLVPVVAIWLAAWRDHATAKASLDERSNLLPTTSSLAESARLPVYMYSSHFLSSWGDRMWQFAMPLLFMEIFVDTLLPSALFSLIVYIVGVLTVPIVGAWIDHTNRLRVMQISIVVENGCIVLSTISLGSILYVLDQDPTTSHWSGAMLALFGVTVVAGAIGQAYTDAQTLSIQQDWVVVVARDTGVPLGEWNASLRQINLLCSLVSPAAFGCIMEFAGSDPMTRAAIGASVVGVWNLLAAPLEYCMRVETYHLVPALQSQPTQAKKRPSINCRQYMASWLEYYQHPTFLVSVSFCALYMTVLTGSGLNLAYLQWRGVPQSILGTIAGLGALSGLLGTLLFPVLTRYLQSVPRVAVVSVWLFWLTLAPIWVACVWYGESSASDYIMMGMVLISRMWLWACDLAETQIMQEWVEPEHRGTLDQRHAKCHVQALLHCHAACGGVSQRPN
ncbi:Aste57867_17 [Aphanomyces stellatus]|uniref:Solute carrier family 40 member n=1 Tax=Aphanomyces stellatus TaxID=120398 RepID=A0A485K5N1_9STRA|nr:hypothetical protein As57867_000017 [Aphanomyces stellatus]VFT77243.1 Aste57867_17 [Aphanomyces stellatus]